VSDQQRPSTSLILLVLTLLTGIALGWLLRDTLRNSSAQVATPPRPTTDALPTTHVIPITTPTPAPSGPSVIGVTVAPLKTASAPASPEPTIAPAPPTGASPVPTPQIVGYAGHIVGQGETLATIAADGGSTPDLVARYNLLDSEARPGRALIVPRIAGHAATLESAPILVQRGRTDKPWVALTLDAGASAEPVPRMLKTLREHNVHITFFLTGKWIKENPDLARQIVADGHEIANHTFSHPDLTRLDDASIRQELADTEALLSETAGATSRPLFRPPFGAYDERVLRIVEGEGYLPVYWTLDSLDSVGEPKTPEFLVERVTGKLTPEQLRGAIILAHCGSSPTADTLPQILDRFAEMGFEVKKVSEVLES
jgi:peptidoglycan/xylan/chitin deacetylase (PgdA/CDA1 family)